MSGLADDQFKLFFLIKLKLGVLDPGAKQGQNLWGGQIQMSKTLGWSATQICQFFQGLYLKFRIFRKYWGGHGHTGHPSNYSPD